MKLHNNKDYLKKRYITQKKTPEDIAKECNVTVQTIYTQLKKHGLRK